MSFKTAANSADDITHLQLIFFFANEYGFIIIFQIVGRIQRSGKPHVLFNLSQKFKRIPFYKKLNF